MTNPDSAESQSSTETAAAEISRSSVTRAATETPSGAVKFVTVTGSASCARTATSRRETNADDATPAKMERPGRRKCLRHARVIGIARCVTTTTSHGERSANGAMQTRTEHLELRVAVTVNAVEVEVDSEVDVDHSDLEVVAAVGDAGEAADLVVVDRAEEDGERREVAVDVVDSVQTNPSVTRRRPTRKSLSIKF